MYEVKKEGLSLIVIKAYLSIMVGQTPEYESAYSRSDSWGRCRRQHWAVVGMEARSSGQRLAFIIHTQPAVYQSPSFHLPTTPLQGVRRLIKAPVPQSREDCRLEKGSNRRGALLPPPPTLLPTTWKMCDGRVMATVLTSCSLAGRRRLAGRARGSKPGDQAGGCR